MSVESPPFPLQSGSYGAEQVRRAVAARLDRGASVGSILGGLVGPTDCQVAPGSGMAVTVSPGEVWVPGSTSVTQSGYYCFVSSSTSLAIAAADPTNPRIDRVVAQVQDAAYSGSTNSFQVAVVTGTPTAGTTLTTLNGVAAQPASSLTLGYVLVPAGASSLLATNILNVAPLATNATSPLAHVTASSSITLKDGQWAEASAGVTITLPMPVVGGLVGVVAENNVTGASPVTVATAAGGGSINGRGLASVASFPLGTPGAAVMLASDGSGWDVIAGEQDSGWVDLSLNTNWVQWSGTYTPAYRICGDRVEMCGGVEYTVTSGVPAGNVIVLNAPAPAAAVFPIASVTEDGPSSYGGDAGLQIPAGSNALSTIAGLGTGTSVTYVSLDLVRYRLS